MTDNEFTQQTSSAGDNQENQPDQPDQENQPDQETPRKSAEFDAAMARLKEIEKSVSSENTSLEECLDLLDESVALADICVKSVNSGLEESEAEAEDPEKAI